MSTDPLHDRLRKRWQSLELPGALFDRLVERYGEAHRQYHNLNHIDDCFTQWQSYLEAGGASDTADSKLLSMAIFYHDAIYDPTRNDNEAASARLAKRDLATCLPPTELETVEALILATAHFDLDDSEKSTPNDAALIVDIDLSILGRDAATYDHYARAIRREYGHVGDTRYRQGRAQVVSGFLALPEIYARPYFRKQFEMPARANLHRELDVLSRRHK